MRSINPLIWAIILCAVTGAASAQDVDPAEPTELPTEQDVSDHDGDQGDDADDGAMRRRIPNPNDLLQILRVSEGERDGLFKQGPITVLHPHWQDLNNTMDEDIGLRLGVTYYLLYQWATEAAGPATAGSGDLDFFGRWSLLRDDDGTTGILGFNIEHRHRYTEIPPSDLDGSIGSIWRTTRGFTNSGFNFNELWWDQDFLDDRISFRIGTINQKHHFDLHRFKSQKRFFLGFPLSDSPTIAFPKNGFGGVFKFNLVDNLYLVAGLGDANGTRSVGTIATFFSEAEYFSAMDLIATPTIRGLGEGQYSVTAWYTDASTDRGRPSGYGFSALGQQEVVDGVVPFVRYGYGTGADLAVEHMVAAGVGVEHPFGQEDDVAGVGMSWSRPTASALRDQWGFEAFYRLQITPVWQLTPGFQLIVDPSLAPGEDVIGIWQLRLGVVF